MRAGDFCTARKGFDAGDVAYVNAEREKGTPDTAIARMIGKPLSEIRALPKLPTAAPERVAPVIAHLPLAYRKRDVAAILERVARRNGVTVADLIGKSQKRCYAEPRQEAYHLIHQLGRYSLSQIGAMIGGRDHTSILHGLRKYLQRLSLREAA